MNPNLPVHLDRLTRNTLSIQLVPPRRWCLGVFARMKDSPAQQLSLDFLRLSRPIVVDRYFLPGTTLSRPMFHRELPERLYRTFPLRSRPENVRSPQRR